MNKQIKQEAKRLMELFKKPIMKWNGIEWVEKVEENKQDAIKCIDEKIKILNENDSGDWNAAHEAYQSSIIFEEKVKEYT